MHNILIVDDQQYKLDDIRNQLNAERVIVDSVTTLFSAKSIVNIQQYDLILLDITLKNSISKNEFVGIDVLAHLQENEINTPVIAITQFYNFNDYSLSKDKAGFYLINEHYCKEFEYNLSPSLDVHILPNLHEYLSQNFINYYGCVLYLQNDTVWINCLKKMLFKLGGEKYENFIIG